jgi:hypothetical protein
MSLDKRRSEVHEDPAIGRLAISTVQVPLATDVIFASRAPGCKDSVDHCVQSDDQFWKLG